MARADFRTRLKFAAKALTGIFTDQSLTQAYSLLSGIYPAAVGAPPQRGTKELLKAYSEMPWLRAVTSKIAKTVASTQWQLFAPTNMKRDRIIQRSYGVDRQVAIAKALQAQKLKPIENHILLDTLAKANDFLVGPSLFSTTQIHLDLVGEAFWIKERNGLGAPVGFWPVPPDWIRETPTPTRRFYKVGFAGWQGEIPDTEIVWFVDPDPSNPYGRGSGLARTLSDELETDEYAARHTRMTFINRARPDLIIWPEESKHDSGTISPENAQRLGERWRAEHQGFWRAALPFFATRKLGVHEVGQSFQDLQLTDLRKYERDVILQVFGMPPEELGIIENSNRATIDASDFLYKKNVIVPRLEFLRAYMQERLIPEYDDRLIINFASPVGEDREFQLKAATAAPFALQVDEWRALSGHAPLPNDQGKVHMVATGVTPKEDISEPPPPPPTPPANPGPPGSPMAGESAARRAMDLSGVRFVAPEIREVLDACKDAGDSETERDAARFAEHEDDTWPQMVRMAASQEPAFRRAVRAVVATIGEDVTEKELERAVSAGAGAVIVVLDLDRWERAAPEALVPSLQQAFLRGAELAAQQAKLRIGRGGKAPQSVPFNVVNPAAMEFAQTVGAQLVAAISASTRESIQDIVAASLQNGWDARKTAKLIKPTVGLTRQHSEAVLHFMEQLVAAEVKPEVIQRRVTNYAKALHQYRAMNIARTELMTASNTGQQYLWDQAAERGYLDTSRMDRKWIASPDDRLCSICEPMDREVVPYNGTFSGGYERPPAHPSCRCTVGLVKKQAEVQQDDLAAAVEKGMAPLREMMAQFQQRLAEPRQEPPPQINVTVPPAQPPVVNVHVDPGAIRSDVHIDRGAIHVDTHVNAPEPTAMVRTVERDADGGILRVVDTPVKSPGQPRKPDGRFDFTVDDPDMAVINRPSSAYPKGDPKAHDSESMYKVDGKWTPERQELHTAISNEHFKGKKPAEGQPKVTFMGGGPASGKSTLPLEENPAAVKVDSDHIKGMLPDYKEKVAGKDFNAAAFVHEESTIISKNVSARAATGGYDTLVDGTGNGEYGNLQKKVGAFRAAGHSVEAHYVTVDTDVAVGRAIKRAQRTGRMVPETAIRETHASVSRVLPRAIADGLFDNTTLWDNNGSSPKKIMTATGKKMTILDPEAWEKFLAKGNQ